MTVLCTISNAVLVPLNTVQTPVTTYQFIILQCTSDFLQCTDAESIAHKALSQYVVNSNLCSSARTSCETFVCLSNQDRGQVGELCCIIFGLQCRSATFLFLPQAGVDELAKS